MKNIYFIIIILGSLLFGSSCNKSILNENPPNLITGETLLKNYDGFEAGINGAYSLVRTEWEGVGGSTAVLADLFMNGTDNMVTNHSVSGANSINQEWGPSVNSTNAFFAQTFEWLYNIVNSCNSIISHAVDPEVNWNGGNNSAEDNKNRIIAEAKALRAWAYRHLSFNWGDVPLNLVETKGSLIKTDWERAPVDLVRRQILDDLIQAEPYIPIEGSLAGRITKGAVEHYVAEMYLTIGKPDSAVYWADKVINNPSYKLITSRFGVNADKPGVVFMDMFQDGNMNRNDGNSEALWVFQFKKLVVGGGVNLQKRQHVSRYSSMRVGSITPLKVTVDRGGNGLGRMSLTKWAIENYDSDDDRGSNFAIRKYFILQDAKENAPAAADILPPGKNFGDTIWLDWEKDISATSRSRTNWPFSRKSDWGDPSNLADYSSYKDVLYLRAADTYLLKAEAQFKLNDPAGAANTINLLRERSNATPVTASEISLDFILDERSRELVLEEERRYTLLRTGKWLERVRLYNHNGGQNVEDRDTLFPIPQTVIDANLTQVMPQNPGF